MDCWILARSMLRIGCHSSRWQGGKKLVVVTLKSVGGGRASATPQPCPSPTFAEERFTTHVFMSLIPQLCYLALGAAGTLYFCLYVSGQHLLCACLPDLAFLGARRNMQVRVAVRSKPRQARPAYEFSQGVDGKDSQYQSIASYLIPNACNARQVGQDWFAVPSPLSFLKQVFHNRISFPFQV